MLLILKLMLFRLVAVFIVRSWFVPDEFFQSVEVAHHLLFGTGHLTWEWSAGLRSALHPLFCAAMLAPFKLLSTLLPATVFWIPRIGHAVLFAMGDWSFLRLTHHFYANYPYHGRCARFANIMYFSNWFLFYCSPRTLANSVETALVLIALNWYPFPVIRQPKIVWPYMSIGALSIIIRPTAAIIWICFGLAHLRYTDSRKTVITLAIAAISPVFLLGILIDSIFYGRSTFSLYNFLSFNVLQGGSAFFGVHPWWWYFTEGIPAILHIQLLPLLMIFCCLFNIRPSAHFPTMLPLWTSIIYVLAHSTLPHKEHRFLLPIIPFLLLYTGPFALLGNTILRRSLKYLIVIGNFIASIYFGLFHQIGPYSAASFLLQQNTNGGLRLGTLMPCFSMPEHAFFHNKLAEFRSLDCSPPSLVLNSNETIREGWMDEADRFHEDPSVWVHAHRKEVSIKSHLVLFAATYKLLETQLWEMGFSECFRTFHAHILTSNRQDHYIVVACRH